MLRIRCPEPELRKSIRIDYLFQEMDAWISSDALTKLVRAFSGQMPEDLDLKSRIYWLNSFVNIWDYRKKQANGGERWQIKDDQQVKNNKELILSCARELGLIDAFDPIMPPDYLLPLGGARLTNYVRPLSAKHLVEVHGYKNLKVVALSGKRPINVIEKPFLMEYAPNAQTEFDAISSGLAKSFEISDKDFEEDDYEDNNINLSWSVRHFLQRPNGIDLFSLAAPSTVPKRRANSIDTFIFFLDHFNIKKGQRLLLVTSSIYVPFQLLRFMPYAIDQGFYVDCVGCDPSLPSSSFSQPSNYLQEIKATVNAMADLVKRYL